MAKVELKTKPNDASVESFLNGVTDEQRRTDSFRLVEMFSRVTGEEAQMWGPSIIGFGHRTVYRSDGKELDWLISGFSPRKTSLTLYVLNSFPKQAELLESLGKHKASGGCLHIKKMTEIDEEVLESLIKGSVEKAKDAG